MPAQTRKKVTLCTRASRDRFTPPAASQLYSCLFVAALYALHPGMPCRLLDELDVTWGLFKWDEAAVICYCLSLDTSTEIGNLGTLSIDPKLPVSAFPPIFPGGWGADGGEEFRVCCQANVLAAVLQHGISDV